MRSSESGTSHLCCRISSSVRSTLHHTTSQQVICERTVRLRPPRIIQCLPVDCSHIRGLHLLLPHSRHRYITSAAKSSEQRGTNKHEKVVVVWWYPSDRPSFACCQTPNCRRRAQARTNRATQTDTRSTTTSKTRTKRPTTCEQRNPTHHTAHALQRLEWGGRIEGRREGRET
jgi:hypothetical protein